MNKQALTKARDFFKQPLGETEKTPASVCLPGTYERFRIRLALHVHIPKGYVARERAALYP